MARKCGVSAVLIPQALEILREDSIRLLSGKKVFERGT